MKSHIVVALTMSLSPLLANAAQSMYCPGNHTYINTGMTAAEVLSACGEPISKNQSNHPVVERIPVTQLIYTTLNQGAIYQGLTPVYTMFSIGSGSQGISLSIDIINNKVQGMSINGSSSNASTLCQGVTLQKGDDISQVYSACGSPSMVNNTYINKAVPSTAKPEVWIYQIDQYQPLFSLTFVNGQLQSIE